MNPRISRLVVALLAVVAVVAPASAAVAPVPGAGVDLPGPLGSSDGGAETVNVTAGQQLSTVIAVTSDDVRSEYRETAFDHALRNDSADRAELVARRGNRLLSTARDLESDYRTAVERYRRGEITRSELARRLAVLGWRARQLTNATVGLLDRAEGLSRAELREAGLNVTALDAAVNRVDGLRGAGTAALLERFTGETEGNVSVGVDDGVSVEVERDDGSRTRELDRDSDGDDDLAVDRSRALSAARDALSDADGRWVVVTHATNARAGVYVFAFRLESNASAGTAAVSVDGSSGEVVRVEEVTTPRGDGPAAACAGQIASLQAEMLAKIRGADSAEERAAVEQRFRERIRTVRAECSGAPREDPAVNRSTALSTARDALPETGGNWTLEGSYRAPRPDAHDEYVFEFSLASPTQFGVARVRVDAVDGSVLGVEERITNQTGAEPVNRSTALATAREALSDPPQGTWRLADSRKADGRYGFAFRLAAGNASGHAEVVVDARSGTVVEVDESVEEADEGTVNRSVALSAAREALSDPPQGSWELRGSNRSDGAYEFAFRLAAPNASGRARVVVDAATATAVDVDESVAENRTDDGETINRSRAAELARAALTDPPEGRWELTANALDAGVYTVEFLLHSPNANGTATVRVEALTGAVLSVSENVTGSENDTDGIGPDRALEVARSALPSVEGTWVLNASGYESGVYYFAFEVDSTAVTGRADVGVDEATGAVVHNETTVTESGDDDGDSLNRSEAETVARSALSPVDGTWVLNESGHETGTYYFRFVVDSENATGWADVGVDEDTGDVVHYEENVTESSDDTLTRSEAEEVARTELSSRPDGTWTLETSGHESGVYYFSFGLDSTGESGYTEVGVDEETGAVVYYEVQYEKSASTDEKVLTEADAEGIARDALWTDPDGTWTLERSGYDDGMNVYYFQFDLDSTESGTLNVGVDAEEGTVVVFEVYYEK